MQFGTFIFLICWTGFANGGVRDEYMFGPSDLDDELTQNLYKRLSQIDPEELKEELFSEDMKVRDPEVLDNSQANSAYIYMSGGAGEGKQHLKPDGSLSNPHQVKSDDALPFYCHPPNPCPKGYEGKDGCHDFVEDTAEYQKEWIKKMQSKGLCSCDEEHMFECGSGKAEDEGADMTDDNYENENEENHDSNEDPIDAVINSIVSSKTENPYLHAGVKRQSLVAKKSPRFKRDLKEGLMEEAVKRYSQHHKENPYLRGKKLRIVAKKGSLG